MIKKWLSFNSVFLSHVRFLTIFGMVFCIVYSSISSPQEEKTEISKEMEKRLHELLNSKTEYFFKGMAHRDQYLNYLIQNVNNEMKLRKKEGGLITETDFSKILDDDNKTGKHIVAKYQQELAKILGLIDELNSLEKASQAMGNTASSEKISKLKSRLKSVLEVTDVGRSDIFSDELASSLIKDYDQELNKLINIIQELHELRDKSKNSVQVRTQVDNLETRISDALRGISSSSDPVLDSYIEEVMRIVDILYQLDELDQQVPAGSETIHVEISNVKSRIFDVVGRETLVSFGYNRYVTSDKSLQFAIYFDEWKARQMLWFLAKQKEAEMVKNQLISSGSADQTRRMFEMDVRQAIKQHNEGNFEVAGYLFQDILRFYPYKNMDDMQYYLAECLMTQKRYTDARELYSRIVRNNQDIELCKRSYWRLMLICDSYQQYRDFFKYADHVLKLYQSNSADDFLEKVVFYAGYIAYKRNDFNRSIMFLEQLSKKAIYYNSGQFLIAVNYINLNRSEKAKPMLSLLCKESTYGQNNEISSNIRNLALLKVGLLYYNDNDLVNALHTLQQVDKNIPGYDIALLSRAWAWFRLGNLQNATNDLDVFFWDYLGSNYIYEAMMLSSHCNRLLGNIKSSVRKARYVENAEKTEKIFDKINVEQQNINLMLLEIDALEEQAVISGETYAYQKLVELRHNLELSLQAMDYQGDPGLQLIQEFEEEQQRLEELYLNYQNMLTIADVLGDKKLQEEIKRNLKKLDVNLLTIQKFQSDKRVDVLADYPVARKESDLRFQKQKFATLRNDVKNEQRKIEMYKREVATLLKKAEESQNSDILNQIDYRKLELEELKNRLDVFWVSLSENDVKVLDTDFKRWSDFSGFGMSDLDFVRMKSIEKNIEQYNDNLSLINSALKQKEKDILNELAIMDKKISGLEQSVYLKDLEKMKVERERYFSEDYFINQTSELETDANQELKLLLEQQMKASSDSTKVKKDDNP